jgi:hypothetical protein
VTLSRTLTLAARVIVATAWAACLVILGLLIVADAPPSLPVPLPRSSWVFAGLATISAGVFLFMTVVADRLVPSVGRRQTMWGAEMAVFAAFLLSSVLSLVLAIRGVS